MRLFLWALTVLVLSPIVWGESRTQTDVVSTAEDAFGIVLGPESLGLYNAANVRGFNPLAAGNVRLDGLYFDQQGQMVERLVRETRIRVGLSAVSFPWPAPTGIVDYALREPKDRGGLAAIVYAGPYESREIDVDGATQLWNKRVGVAAGASYRRDVDLPGLTARIYSVGVLPQWSPRKDLSVQWFWGRRTVEDAKTMPTVYLGAGRKAPPVPARYFGQDWTGADYCSQHYGMLVSGKLGERWSLRAGVFHSAYELPRSSADIFLDTTSNGFASHELVLVPSQHYESLSGEARLSHTVVTQAWAQVLDMGLRGRKITARYGGADSVDLGVGIVGQVTPVRRQGGLFGATTSDHISELSFNAAYQLEWSKRVSLTIGLQRPSYSRKVGEPASGNDTSSVRPWLYNSSFVVLPGRRLAVFGALTQGLEDSGVAPENASNRGAVLGAARSRQAEAGVRYTFSPTLKGAAGVFETRKPYFALDGRGEFAPVGEERHRGVELSLAGELTSRISIVAGALILSPRVLAVSPMGHVGSKPVGEPSRILQLSVSFRVPRIPGLSLDGVVGDRGAQMVRADDRAEIPGSRTVDLGARYETRIQHRSFTFRAQVLNVGNCRSWYVAADGGMQPIEPRRVWAYVVVDL